MVDRLEALCKQHKTNFSKLEKTLGFANGSLKKSDPAKIGADRVKKLADYFGVSMEYIMTGETPAAPVLLDIEKQIIEAYRRMSPELKTALYGFMGIKGELPASETAEHFTA